MHLSIEGKHLVVTPALNSYVKEKVQKVKNHFKSNILHIKVRLSVTKTRQEAEATITIRKHHFHNRYASEDMYGSIDILFDKLERQVRRYKEAIREKKRTKIHFQTEANMATEALKSEPYKLYEVPYFPKPLSLLEAILQLQLEKKVPIIGYRSFESKNHTLFLEKVSKEHYSWTKYSEMWEQHEVLLSVKEEVQVVSAMPITVPTETIEDAANYLISNHETSRFFHSVRSQKMMLLYQKKDLKELYVVREE